MDRTIGFIGLGNTGWNMASHLARSGYEVLGYDARPEVMARFTGETGFPSVTSLAELGRASASIRTSTPTPGA